MGNSSSSQRVPGQAQVNASCVARVARLAELYPDGLLVNASGGAVGSSVSQYHFMADTELRELNALGRVYVRTGNGSLVCQACSYRHAPSEPHRIRPRTAVSVKGLNVVSNVGGILTFHFGTATLPQLRALGCKIPQNPSLGYWALQPISNPSIYYPLPGDWEFIDVSFLAHQDVLREQNA